VLVGEHDADESDVVGSPRRHKQKQGLLSTADCLTSGARDCPSEAIRGSQNITSVLGGRGDRLDLFQDNRRRQVVQ
jgi:hypothetical protein